MLDYTIIIESADGGTFSAYLPDLPGCVSTGTTLDDAIESIREGEETGLHLGATVGRMQVCAEVTALGRAILEGDGTIECAVALRHPKPEEALGRIAVVPPCGACRELLTDYDPDASVIVPGLGGLHRVRIGVLLPSPYQR